MIEASTRSGAVTRTCPPVVSIRATIGSTAVPRRTSWRLAVLAVGVLGQWWWIDQMLVQGTTFTQIP